MKSVKPLFQSNKSSQCRIGTSSDGTIAYKEFTPIQKSLDSENIPIILLHGLMRGKETWDECGQIISIRTNTKVYSLDARNHGDSKWVDTMDYDSMTDDVVHFMDSMMMPKAIILGHGMGAKTGMVLALKYPERIHSLITEDTSLNSHSKNREQLKKSVEKFDEILEFISFNKGLNEAKRTAVSCMVVRHYYYTIKKRQNKPRIWDGSDLPLKPNKDKGGFEWNLNLKSIAENMPCEPWKKSGVFKGPVLMIYGTNSSNNVLDERVEFLKLFPRALYKAIKEGVDYPLHIEYPDMFAELVCDFILKQRR
ncbi:uncharacterized protein [Parasteatoda tepidariorum]|uniref:uncharacterized protein n=1 Tax=Parasteatoda tepidariorum TaxID=114398 RepID=UPI001C729BAB|nr:abhydrolase domain-containing protein C22H12.03-like [Parasteatoda tepidariorum]